MITLKTLILVAAVTFAMSGCPIRCSGPVASADPASTPHAAT